MKLRLIAKNDLLAPLRPMIVLSDLTLTLPLVSFPSRMTMTGPFSLTALVKSLRLDTVTVLPP